MKRKILFFCLLSLITIFAFGADVPAWLKNTETEFPDSLYIKSVGEGSSVKKAQNAALSTIALFFDTKITYVKVAVEHVQEIATENKNFFSSSESYQHMTEISSEANFFCVKFTEAYYDKKSDAFSILAYIDKKEAAEIYTARIVALMEAVNVYRAFANTETEPLRAVMALHKAELLASLAKTYIRAETTIIPSDSTKFMSYLKTIELLPTERDARTKELTFSITIQPSEKRYAPLFSTIAKSFESYGGSYLLKDVSYTVIADIFCTEEHYEAGEFVRPSVDVLVVNKAGAGVYTYSKTFQRIGSNTLEQAYTRAVSAIQQDLEEHFLSE